MLKRILVPLDGSTVAEGVLPYVRALAPALKAKVELLRIGERDAAVDLANPMVGQYMDRVGAALRGQSEDYLNSIKRTFKDTLVEYSTRVGKPAEIIAEEGAKEVAEGSHLAEEASGSLQTILSAVEVMSGQLEQISASSEEMSASGTEMVTQMDKVSSVVEEVTAATEEMHVHVESTVDLAASLNGLATDLQGAVTYFRNEGSFSGGQASKNGAKEGIAS